jgi:hypothetical protein
MSFCIKFHNIDETSSEFWWKEELENFKFINYEKIIIEEDQKIN